MRSTRAYLLAIAILMAAAVALQVWRDRGWVPYEPATSVMWVPNAQWVRGAALGFDTVLADVYWIRTVVYFGRQRLSAREDKNYDLLFPLLDLVTLLDPRFAIAYRFGALFLTEPPPGGPDRPDQAIELLQRGVARTPERWEYLHDIGFVHAWSRRDYEEAARWFERASLIPGAPFWLKSTAASMLIRGGDRASARQMWQQMYDDTDVDWFKRSAATHLARFDALDAIDRLNDVVWRYKSRVGHMPRSWQELVHAGVLRGIPLDPSGVPFEIDSVNEDVRLSSQSTLSPLPRGFDAGKP